MLNHKFFILPITSIFYENEANEITNKGA